MALQTVTVNSDCILDKEPAKMPVSVTAPWQFGIWAAVSLLRVWVPTRALPMLRTVEPR